MDKLNKHYIDRGVKKYMGFYLSEHTRELEKNQTLSNHVNLGLESMSSQEIGEIIEVALLKNKMVLVQPNIRSIDGQGFDDNIVGKIVGICGDLLYIDNMCISLNLIRHINLLDNVKWFKRNEA